MQGKELPLENADRIIKARGVRVGCEWPEEALIAEIQGSPVKSADAMRGLLEDLEGQVTEALSREDWYKKWGHGLKLYK